MTITGDSPFVGVCTLSREAFIAAIVAGAASGCVGERDTGEYWDACMGYAIDPNLVAAMFQHESQMGQKGVAVETHSWGNTRAPNFGAVPVGEVPGRTGTFPVWANWLDGCISTAARLASTTYPAASPYGLRPCIHLIFDDPSGAVWAPAGDLNDPAGYLRSVLDWMNAHTDMSDTNGGWRPTIVDDYTPINYTYGRRGSIEAVCVHTTAGSTAASAINWFQNPASQVSAHYVVDWDGTIYRVVREPDTAWANGVVNRPDVSNALIAGWVEAGVNPNDRTVSIERVGYPDDPWPPSQWDAVAWLIVDICVRNGLEQSRATVIQHSMIDSVNRPQCADLDDDEFDALLVRGWQLMGDEPQTYDTPDAAYDAWCAAHGETVAWAGQLTGKAHWYGREPQEVSRTSGPRLLAYDGAVAQDATGWTLDEWQQAALASGQLTIWGLPAPTPPDPAPQPPAQVGAAWPINPGDGLSGFPVDGTLTWGKDASAADVQIRQSTDSWDGPLVLDLENWMSDAYGPMAFAPETTYVWRLRGREAEAVSGWSEATFDTATPAPAPGPDPPTPNPKPPTPTTPFPPVITPDYAADPSGQTWRNVHDNKVDLAVSRQWRPDCDGGAGPWPDTAQWTDPDYPGRTDPDASWREVRALTRRLSMMPAITEMLLRTGTLDRLPADFDVCASQWADAAAQDYGDDCAKMPGYARTWASRLCGLATAIQQQPTLGQALAARGFSTAEAQSMALVYKCLRKRTRNLGEVSGCGR
jgi:hypothetical protein